LGRLDHQVKVRGYRIELGEIEGALGEQAGVVKSAVVLREDEGGEKRLVGYVEAVAGGVTAEQLREGLRQRLPDYMIPSAFVLLDALPLTPNGKIDRHALPAPVPAEMNPVAIYEPPRNALEETLTELWASMTKVERVGIHSNFFELGGHSLLATSIMARLRETHNVDMPLRSIFEAPTVAQFALRLEQQQRIQKDRNADRIPVRTRGDKGLDQLLTELARLSDDEVRQALAGEIQL
jgi:hypothetical protein